MTALEGGVQVLPVTGLGEIAPGTDLADAIYGALTGRSLRLADGDVVVITQKVVSKAENRLVSLAEVEPSGLARAWAEQWGKDPRQVEVVLRECRRLVRMDRGVIVGETRHGFVCANAGVDASNVAQDTVCLLPVDADASADRIRAGLESLAGARIGVVISDTFGRAWREGQINVAIGVSGIEPITRYAGSVDPSGYELRVTAIAIADEIAGAAELVMGKLDRVPVALLRGLRAVLGDGSARSLVRPAETDMFR